MIKIQDHLNRSDADVFLDALALTHWNELNPKLKKGKGYKVNSLIEKCKKYKHESTLKRYRKKYANDDVDISRRHTAFFKFLLLNNAFQLKRFIIARPTDYSNIIADVLAILSPSDLYVGNQGNYSQTPFGVLLSKKIFNYTAFRASDFCKDLFGEIGFNSSTCPYCNDNAVIIVEIENTSTAEVKKRAYLDLDHFYSKSQNPFFAISFFNLIPTCHDCNSFDKGDRPFTIETHVHPYLESFDDLYKFEISLKTLLGDAVDNINILKLSGKKPLDVTLNDLQLSARYNANFNVAEDLIGYFLKYNHYVGTIDEQVFIDAIFEINGVPQFRNSILNKQKGKLKRDILKQFDINNILKIQ